MPSTILRSLTAFKPRPLPVSGTERLRGAAGGALGIAVTSLVSLIIARYGGLSPWLVAPLGASAVLIFAVPSSPLAQPWSVVGGNTISALVGVLACALIPDPTLAGALAVGGAIGAMFAARCLHPPGGAMALLVVLSHSAHWPFVLFPALTNSLLLVACGVVFNTITRRPYPHLLTATPPPASGLLRISDADFAEALSMHNEVLDIDAEELSQIMRAGEMIALRRMAAHLICAQVMTPNPFTAVFGTALLEAWQTLERNDIKALPVTDRAGRVLGVITVDEFDREARKLNPSNYAAGLSMLLTPSPDPHSELPQVVGQIMSTVFAAASPDTSAADLMPLFSEGDHRHIVVLDTRKKLVGIVSASDIMRSLFHKAA